MKRPEMIVFDYGHTLYDEAKFDALAGSEAVLSHAVSNPEGITAQVLMDKAGELNAYIGRYEPDKVKDYLVEVHNLPFIRYIYEYFGLTFDLPLLDIEYIFWEHAAPGKATEGIIDLLEHLRENGIRTGVISNLSFSGNALARRIGQDIDVSHFEFMLSTADYLFRKPSPKIFELALKKAGLSPEKVWYCGDNVYCDVEGAAAVGMIPVWYTGANDTGVYNGMPGRKIVTEVPVSDHLKVGSWSALQRILRELD